ncbi:integrase family protein [Aquicella lusitana]|uniref:Site-specific recombinase XerD n=1 Tax=Aquicella lusitana TaxID=254246 RepID=A0A370G562_9COXI|nr:integrase family protein [Aquicella lusitana]RDI37193.1 site-specific recombinase XerD [Aquicella lusitana]VVC72559.1 Tyrosine recombinase XerC [Aquicella lusitana]
MARIKLSKSKVDELPFTEQAGAQAFYYDTELKGFGLRISNKTKTYIAETKVQGKTVRVSLGRHGVVTAEEARKEAKVQLAAMTKDVNPNQVQRENRIKTITLNEVYTHYMAARKSLKPSTKRDYKTCIEVYLKDWMHKPMLDITRDMVESKHKEISEKSEARANLAMRFLRALFNFAAEYRDAKGRVLIADNPVRRLSAKKIWNKIKLRSNYIQPHQLKAWWDAVWALKNDPTRGSTQDRESVRDYLLVLLFTGLRREEALSLTWDNINFESKTLKIFDTKNRSDHELPLSNFLFNLFMRRKKDNTCNWVFPGSGKLGRIIDPRKLMQKVEETSGISFTSHDMRRTFASIVNMLGDSISYYTVKRLLNHKSSDVTAGYIQHNPEKLREAMQAVSDFILKNVTVSAAIEAA